MKYRTLGKTGLEVSAVSLGTWQVGGKWGSGFDRKNAHKILNEAIDQGINFIDTADVYEGGLSEQAVGKIIRSRSEEVYIATKCGRQINPHNNEGYTPKILRGYVEDSLCNTKLDCIDLIQLHCPPIEVYYRPEIFEEFDKLKQEGKIKHLGVSVEKIEEALKAIEYSNVCTVQIIYNMFRHRPNELFFREAKRRNVGIIARVPLASGLLTGKYKRSTSFESTDHRHFNREGAYFDKGETFSGVDYNIGLKAAKRLKKIFPDEVELVHVALRWILMYEAISTVIPGASRLEQLISNLEAIKMRKLKKDEMKQIEKIYQEMIYPMVHHQW